MDEEMKKLKELGFKKVNGTEAGFHMWELTPSRLSARAPITADSEANKLASSRARKQTSSQANKLDKD